MVKLGRPTTFTQEKADELCHLLACGISLKSVCLDPTMPCERTVFMWMRTNEAFLQQYARAKEESADAMAEAILDLSDGAIAIIKSGDKEKSSALAQAVRLQVDTRKWIMSKMKPKKYGEKIDMTTNGKDLPTPIYGGKSTEKV